MNMYLKNIWGLNINYRFFSLSTHRLLDQRWRRARGMPINPNSEGILFQNADYSFLDGKPTPYGSRQKNRILKQREYADKIITLSKEIDFAIERHEEDIRTKKKRKQDIIANKLKPKGQLLLQTK